MFFNKILIFSFLVFLSNDFISKDCAKELKSQPNVGHNSDSSSSLYTTDESIDDKSYIYLLVIFLVIYLTGIIATLSLYVLITNNFIDILQFIVLAFSGFGNVFAGIILFKVQKWNSFQNISGLLILVQPLMGLKGNLEMTMASRLSTLANVGNHMDSWLNILDLIKADMILVQCQATVVSFFAALVAIISVLISGTPISLHNATLLCAISLTIANITCFLLGVVLAIIIVSANKLGYDPDDIATPIAASLGDLSTLFIMAYYSQFLFDMSSTDEFPIIATIIIIFFMICEPILLFMSYANTQTRDVLIKGWYSIILSMFISSLGGLILQNSANRFERLATFQPVFSGFAGNCAALQASRISTSLHRSGSTGNIHRDYKICVSPVYVFCSNDNLNARTAKTLLLFVVIPSQICYLLVIRVIEGPIFELTIPFIAIYIVFIFLEVAFLLYISYILIHLLWKFEHDPDLSSIPILTAFGDFLGTLLLYIQFNILFNINDSNANNQ